MVMVSSKKKSKMDEQQYEGITKFDDEVEMFQEYMDDVDRTIKKKYGKIGLKLSTALRIGGYRERKWRVCV